MLRFLTGVVSALLLAGAGLYFWQGESESSRAAAAEALPLPPKLEEPAKLVSYPDIPIPPAAPEQSKEQKRFNRYDQDRNGAVSQGEYLASRRKAYERLDVNRDGTVSFAEYATKTVVKFAKADSDQSGVLNPQEFAATKPVRKTRPKANCPKPIYPSRQPEAKTDDDEDA